MLELVVVGFRRVFSVRWLCWFGACFDLVDARPSSNSPKAGLYTSVESHAERIPRVFEVLIGTMQFTIVV